MSTDKFLTELLTTEIGMVQKNCYLSAQEKADKIAQLKAKMGGNTTPSQTNPLTANMPVA